MKTQLAIAALIYMMVQGVLFGAGAVLVLATPLTEFAMTLMPWVVAISLIISIPIAWTIAPRMRARYWRREESVDMDRARPDGARA